MPLAPLSAGFQSLLLLPTIKLGPSVTVSQWVGLCAFQDPVGLSNELSCEAGSFCCCLNPPRFLKSGFEALFPHAGTLGCVVCLAPQLLLPVYPHANVGPPALPASVLPTPVLQPLPCSESFLPQLPISALPTSLDECFFFNSLVVALAYSLIFCQFWLFFCFSICCTPFGVQGGKVYLYLHLHLGWKSAHIPSCSSNFALFQLTWHVNQFCISLLVTF